MRIATGLPEAMRADAARIYWQAFGSKLGRVLGPDARALRFLERAISADHAMIALSPQGALLGLIGFRSPKGGFAEGTEDDLRAAYGRIGAMWRGAALRAISRDMEDDRFLIDGICVAPEARGQGLGTALIEAVAAWATAQSFHELRLDVIDTNLRARALYERLGFRITRTESLGPLRYLFGFKTAVTMVRPLA